MAKTIELEIKQILEELLKRLDVGAEVDVVLADGIYQTTIKSEESGLLIGYHGETLASLQSIMGMLVFKKTGEWVRIVVEVGDYRAKRNEVLVEMAHSYANRALEQNSPVAFPPMSASERRIVHLAIQERDDVESGSEGEGRFRHVVVAPKK